MESEKSKESNSTTKNPVFIWAINTVENIQFDNGEYVTFEPDKEYKLSSEIQSSDWFQIAITKGYLKAKSNTK